MKNKKEKQSDNFSELSKFLNILKTSANDYIIYNEDLSIEVNVNKLVNELLEFKNYKTRDLLRDCNCHNFQISGGSIFMGYGIVSCTKCGETRFFSQ